MRLLFIVASFSFFILTFSYAQNPKRVSAYMCYQNGELDKARDFIEPTIENTATKDDAKTWVYRGNIYKAIYRSKDEKYKNLDPDALKKGYESFKKAAELDTKGQWTKEITNEFKNSGIEFHNEAVSAFNAKNFETAINDCNYGLESSMMPQVNFIDTALYYIAGRSAYGMKNYDLAKTYYDKLIGYKYDLLNSYVMLSNIKLMEKDTVGYLSSIQDARKIFPNDKDLISNEIQAYITLKKVPEAINNICEALKTDSNNYSLIAELGILYQSNNEFEKAEIAHKNALKINPNFFFSLYNLGVLYNNKASNLFKDANDLPRNQNAKSESLKSEGMKLLKLSCSYIEKSLEVTENALKNDSKNQDLIQNKKDALTSLKLMYYTLEDPRLQEVSEKLNNL